jgi:hypothetical protein
MATKCYVDAVYDDGVGYYAFKVEGSNMHVQVSRVSPMTSRDTMERTAMVRVAEYCRQNDIRGRVEIHAPFEFTDIDELNFWREKYTQTVVVKDDGAEVQVLRRLINDFLGEKARKEREDREYMDRNPLSGYGFHTVRY